MRKYIILLTTILFAFSGCGQSSEQIADTAFSTVKVFGLEFDFGVPAVRNGEDIKAKEEPYGLLAYVSRISEFDRLPDGIGDYAMSKEIHAEIISSKNPCDVLKSQTDFDMGELHLPFYMNEPFLCSSERRDGVILISIVGRGFPFESLPYVDGGMLIVRPDDVVILSGMIKDDQLAKINSKYRDELLAEYPDVDFPTAEWNELSDKMEAEIADLVNDSDQSLVDALAYIENVSKGTRLD
jgi:hypothetical protein